MMAQLTLLAKTLLPKTLLPWVLLHVLEGILLPHPIGGLPLPALARLPEAELILLTIAILAALLLHGLQELRDDRQKMTHDLANVLRRQGPLPAAEAAAKGGHRLILLLLQLRLRDDLRQHRSDLLQEVADFLLGLLALHRLEQLLYDLMEVSLLRILLLRILESVLLRVVGTEHDDFPLF